MNDAHAHDAEDDARGFFPETETRRVAERFAPAAPPRPVAIQAVRAVEEELRRPEPIWPRLPLLSTREKTHGNFDNTARIAQRLKDVMRDTPNWERLTDVQKEAAEAIATKLARMLSGDPNHKDHWSDVGGAAHLVEERLP